MSTVTRILVVEDCSSDAELNERAIREFLPASEFLCVESKEDYLAALSSFHPDVILSDYKLPSFDGMAALKLALEHVPDTPFIIITGSMNEETAVACLKAGAWDYVIKEHRMRLGPAVINGLGQKRLRLEHKQAEEALKQRNDVLERFNEVTVGREARMVELKKEVNALLLAAGLQKKYEIADAERALSGSREEISADGYDACRSKPLDPEARMTMQRECLDGEVVE